MSYTKGPWEYVPSNEHHGPYVANGWGAGDICDCYTMTNPAAWSVRNGGDSKPVNHQHEEADANAMLISAAPDLLEALKAVMSVLKNEAPGTPINNKKYDQIGIDAYSAIAKAEGR